MSRINTNVSSLSAQARLQRTNKDLQTSLTRLSTGLRINTGADDPAGLIASEALRSDITSLNKALSNTQRASQIIATADSALGQVSSLLNDIRGLVVEAANNGALSDDEIAANQLQVDSSLEAINRISQTTTFQGRKLLDGSLDFLTNAGTGFSTVSDLKIDQANLGATGRVSVEVNISQAASKASILNTGIAATGTTARSTQTVSFNTSVADTEATIEISVDDAFTIGAEASASLSIVANSSTAGAGLTQASGTLSLGANGLSFGIAARSGTSVSGAAGNEVQVEVTTITAGDSNGSYNATTGVLTLNLREGDDGADVVADLINDADLNALFQFSAGSASSQSTRALTLNGGLNLTFAATAGSAVDGVVGNNTEFVVTASASATTATYDPTANRVLINLNTADDIGTNTTAINGLLGGLYTVTSTSTATDPVTGGAAGTYNTGTGVVNTVAGTGDIVRAAFATTSNLTSVIAGGADGVQNGGFTITARDGTIVDGGVGNGIEVVYNSGTANAVSFVNNRLTITVQNGATIGDIINTINSNTDVSALFEISNPVNINNRYNVSNNNPGSPLTPFGSGSNPKASGSFRLEAINGQALDGIRGNTVTFNYTAGTTASTTATYDATSNQVNVTFGTSATVNDVANAIADIDGTGGQKLFQIKAGSVLNGSSRFTPVDVDSNSSGVSSTVVTSGTNRNVTDVITVTAKKDGSEFDRAVTFGTPDNSVAVGAARAAVVGNQIVITTNTGGDVSMGAIVNAINQLSDYTATLTSDPLADNTMTVGTDTATVTSVQSGNQGGGLTADLVFQLSGGNGSETFQFQKGAKIESIVQSINLVKDATGVEAVVEAGNLKFQSTTYGSNAKVAIEVISEGAGGTFKNSLSASRSTGTDIAATVNGYTATGDGNTLSINTASLDMSLTVAAGSSTSVNFEITGGGALFQLGGDVVSNQQARLGISSVSTAKLGGSSGRLFELGSGQSKSLVSDATGAAQVIEEVINKVTSLRGRLGAFQRTTLDSNSVSLTETVANLTEAESSIRDADFAKESAALTRAQILVQSGTNVLSIANQNPQNVLSLLR